MNNRLYNSAWIFGAFLLLAANTYSLMSLFDKALVGNSEAVRLASSKWRQYEELKAKAINETHNIDLGMIFTKFLPDEISPANTGAVSEKENPADTPPVVSGIVELSDVHGNRLLYATINGATYPEKAEVQGYTIEAITQKGVSFTKYGKRNFVPKPEVYYSIHNRQ